MRNSLTDVVTAALRVLDTQGLEQCSMRRIARELGVQPSALYHHVPNKQTLLARMADEIVRGVASTAPPEPPVTANDSAAATSILVALRRAMLAIRDGADVVATAEAFRLGASEIEEQLARHTGADGARTLLLYTFGHAQSTQTHLQAAAFGALLTDSASAPSDHATVARPTHENRARELDESFRRGIAIILAGLCHTPQKQHRS